MSLARTVTVCVGIGLSATLAFGQEPAGVAVPAPGAALVAPVGTPLHQPAATYAPRESYEGAYYEDDCYGEDVVSPLWARWFSKLKGCRKSPFQKYNHHPSDLQCRPLSSPLCSPTWGYHETCWREFPPVPLCPPRCPVYTAKVDDTDLGEVEAKPVKTHRTKQTVYRANNPTRD